MKEHFIIPTNFMETGYVLNGAVSIRNAIEAGILALFGFFVCKLLPLPSGTDAITYYILIIAPFAMVGLSGVAGDPLSVFVWDFIKWRKRRKPCFYNTHGEAYTQEAADFLMDMPQMRDMLADALDKFRANMSAKDVEYVEGKTFEFAADPEQEALRQAQQEITTKREEEQAKRLAEEQQRREEAEKAKPSPFEKPAAATAVNAKEISEMLVLDDLNWGDD